MNSLLALGLALALGLLIGAERGWQDREAPEGRRVAGVRTFALLGLLGGLWGLLAAQLGEIVLGFAFVAVAVVMVIAHVVDARNGHDVGMTTTIAALVTFVLGALAVRGEELIAAAAAVVVATLLSLKPVLHRALQRVEVQELYAALKLLLISVVLLPVLPNRGYGPWDALNPYVIWWMVVLIASISFAGYIAMKLAGARRGILLTGMFGGLVSSTALTLNFARLARDVKWQGMLCAGMLVASATMFPRMLLEVVVVNPPLAATVALPLVVMTLLLGTGAWLLWRAAPGGAETDKVRVDNPLELRAAIQFGLLLAVIMVLAHIFRDWFGDRGVYLVALVSGLSDVDAITLSLSRLALRDLAADVAARGILLAALANTLTKGALVFFVAGARVGARVLPAFLIVASAALAAVFLLGRF